MGHDLTTDPDLQEALLQVRRGTAFIARKLNELSDKPLDGDSLIPCWSRRHLGAHLGYKARTIARLIEWAATGVETPMHSSPTARNQEIGFGAILSSIALRALTDHAAVHLKVEWRELPDNNWSNQVKAARAAPCPPMKLAGRAAAQSGCTPSTLTTAPPCQISPHPSSNDSWPSSLAHGIPAAPSPTHLRLPTGSNLVTI